MEPLASLLRPKTLGEVLGQSHLIGEGKLLTSMVKSNTLMNMIFYGPPGIGKTTVARLLADLTDRKFIALNASTDSLKDVKNALEELNMFMGQKGLLLYIDEIHLFNRRNQQILLDYMESGRVILIGSTTENPHFAVFKALVSRSIIVEFKPLSFQEIIEGLERGILFYKENHKVESIEVSEGVLRALASLSGGDMRKGLNNLELLFLAKERLNQKVLQITEEDAERILQRKMINFDLDGDEHYDLLSAFQKSIRGSDENAALLYLAMLLKGGDLISVNRRLLVIAAEDIGLANPQAIAIVKACTDAALVLGLPEARIPLAQAVLLLATSPKSNSVVTAVDAANGALESATSLEIPAHLRDGHYEGAKAMGRMQKYKYPHAFKNNYVKQEYLPKELRHKQFYEPGANKYEEATRAYWKQIKEEK
ncbi:replication-associated recombination protein A [Proteiniclasticum sp.]|uniref:replication-associated recombination protein A n=1 Tax=Proteiniclasticum sp. TaxID=2053595 RepID=UPI000E9259B5|nr:replication-associated recombination protein A [Proteiniclasticum sp.]HBW12523.1 AAA family ATPase [Proteiniclasticum sp.]